MAQVLISVGGALVVAIITTAAQLYIHRRDAHGSDQRWEHDRRYPAYVGMLATATELAALIQNHERLVGARNRWHPWRPLIWLWATRHVPRLRATWPALVQRLAEIRLLGTPQVVLRGEALLGVLGEAFSEVVDNPMSFDEARAADRSAMMYAATASFRDACREELGQLDFSDPWLQERASEDVSGA